MNRTISTRSGIITALLILAYILLLMKAGINPGSSYNLIQFLILFAGILVSRFFLQRHYAGISFLDSFTHGMRTLATTMVLVIVGNSMLFFIFRPGGEPMDSLTFMIMKTIFAYGVSGLLSALLSSLIFNTFTKK